MPESLRDLLLRYRARTGLTQRDLAARLGIGRRTLQDWETGISHPSAERLQGLIRVLLETGGLTAERAATEAQQLWESVLQESLRMHTPFDEVWLAGLLAEHTAPGNMRSLPQDTIPAAPAIRPATVETGERGQDWGEAPDVHAFIGRTEALALLSSWVLEERCRLVAVLGIGGIGKTSLAARLAQAVAPTFERLYWRSLRDAPPPGDWLAGAIGFLSDHQQVPPGANAERITVFLQLLRAQRCLLALDNFETLFEPGQGEGRYRPGLAGYGRLLQVVSEATHQSCLLLTSREAPAELDILGGSAVRSFHLGGLEVDEARALLTPKQLVGTDEYWTELIRRVGGNGLALKLVGERIHEFFGGEIGAFLAEAGTSSIFGGIRQLLAEQLGRSSVPELQVLRLLAVAREPVRLADILAALNPNLSRAAVLEALEALRRRSLVERAETVGAAAFTLQSVVLEYVIDRLVEAVAEEISGGQPVLLIEQALIQALSKDYVRQNQERLIGAPILERLKAQWGEDGAEPPLLALLNGWRDRPRTEQGYGPGNVVNLLRLLRGDLRGLDLTRLSLRQAYLAEVEAQDASLVGANLAETVLAEGFDFPGTIALSGNGVLLTAGTSTGQVWLWRVADRTPLWAAWGHTKAVWGVALSADGQLVASSGADGTVRLWETSTGQLMATLQGHISTVWSVALSADGHLVASGSEDGTVRLWETSTGQPVATLQGHTGAVRDVALPADGHLVASGGADGTVRLWETSTGQPVATLQGHTGTVWGVALSTDGHVIASGGADGTLRLWKTSTGRPLAVLQGHASTVRGVALSADGHLVASGGMDGTMRLWEADTGRPIATLQGHTGAVWSVALSADGRLAANSSADRTVRLWETGTGLLVATLRGHTGAVWDVALSADGRLAASGSEDGTVQLWETSTGQPVAVLQGHTGAVWAVALSADGHLVASGSEDGTAQLWETSTGRLTASLQGHTGAVRGVALSADGHLVASGGADGMVRLWETSTGLLVATLQGHTGTVWGVALSADGHLVVSSGADRTVRLWETSTGQPVATLQGHIAAVRRVALSADGRLVASSSADGTVQLWETSTGRLMATLQGHTGAVWGVALSADGRLVASGSTDGTVRLWEAGRGALLRILRVERRYERLDITSLTGITEAQRLALLALGAVDRQAEPVGSRRSINA